MTHNFKNIVSKIQNFNPIVVWSAIFILGMSACTWTILYHAHLDFQARNLDRLMEHQKNAHQQKMDLLIAEIPKAGADEDWDSLIAQPKPQSLLSKHANQMASGNYKPAVNWAARSKLLQREARLNKLDAHWKRVHFERKVERIFNPSFEDQLERLVEPVLEKYGRKLDRAYGANVPCAVIEFQLASQQAQNAICVLGIAEGVKELRKLARKKGIPLSELADAGLDLRH